MLKEGYVIFHPTKLFVEAVEGSFDEDPQISCYHYWLDQSLLQVVVLEYNNLLYITDSKHDVL
jgi:hypothetical protein